MQSLKLVFILLMLSVQIGCAQIEKTANYNEQNLTVEERKFANTHWSNLTGLTWNRWSNLTSKADRDFYLEQRLRKDSKAYQALHPESQPTPAPAP